MMRLKARAVMLLWMVSFTVSAEHVQTEVAHIEQEKPQLTKESIAQKTEVLRDPTQMSVNFRQALETYQPAAGVVSGGGKVVNLPIVKLIGKVLAPAPKNGKELSELERQQRSVVALEFNGTIIHLRENDKNSIVKDNQLFTLIVDEITPYYVQVRLLPVNETLLLH